jgi:hypothetical protein
LYAARRLQREDWTQRTATKYLRLIGIFRNPFATAAVAHVSSSIKFDEHTFYFELSLQIAMVLNHAGVSPEGTEFKEREATKKNLKFIV